MLVPFLSRGPLGVPWHPIARTEDVQDKPIAAELLRERVVVWRGPSGTIIAAPDRCTHSKADLSKGSVKDGCLTCPKHGWTFGDEGRCVHNPRRLDDVIEDTAHLSIYRSEERHGLLWVCLDEPRTEIPVVAADDDPCLHRELAVPVRWAAPAPRIVEALLTQDRGDGVVLDFALPFAYQRRAPGGHGPASTVLVACSPAGATASVVYLAVWAAEPSAAQSLLDAEVAALEALKPEVEGIGGMYEIDETLLDDVDAAAPWRRALLAAVSPA